MSVAFPQVQHEQVLSCIHAISRLAFPQVHHVNANNNVTCALSFPHACARSFFTFQRFALHIQFFRRHVHAARTSLLCYCLANRTNSGSKFLYSFFFVCAFDSPPPNWITLAPRLTRPLTTRSSLRPARTTLAQVCMVQM